MNSPHPSHRKLPLALSAAALMLLAATAARAQDTVIVVEPAHATTYVNGGVDQAQAQTLRKTAKDWPLRMIFSERKDKEFVTGVSLLVTDLQGSPYLQLADAGPMTYAMLPPGKYRVIAKLKDRVERQEVALDGKSGRDLYFHWRGSVKTDPFDQQPMGGKQVPG